MTVAKSSSLTADFHAPRFLEPEGESRVPAAIRWSLLLFAFSLPYEQTTLSFLSGSLSLARIAGLVVLASCLIYRRHSVAMPHPALWCFGIYLFIHCLRGLYVSTPFFFNFLTVLQLMLFAWLIAKVL